jgi:N-dimethylarginine dimethylaminohydrolase
MNIGCQTEYGKIERLLLKHPKDAYISQDSIDKQWENLNYSGPTDYKKAVIEYDDFVTLLKSFVPYIEYLPQNDKIGLDSVYVHDPVLITKEGATERRTGRYRRIFQSYRPANIGRHHRIRPSGGRRRGLAG